MDTLVNLDTNIFLMLNGLHTVALDQFMYIFSSRWVWVPAYVVAALCITRMLGWKAGLLLILCTIAAVALSDQTGASLIRPIVRRLRPGNPDNPISSLVYNVNGYRGGSYGFPSCHAANTFAFATVVALALRMRIVTIVVFAWALFNCYTRIYLGVHYPGDLITGAALGSAFGVMMYGVFAICTRRIPALAAAQTNAATYRRCGQGMAGIFTGTAVCVLLYSLAVFML